MQWGSLLCRMSKMADSSKMCGHLTNFFYGSLETGGGTTSPLAQITPLSPTHKLMHTHTHTDTYTQTHAHTHSFCYQISAPFMTTHVLELWFITHTVYSVLRCSKYICSFLFSFKSDCCCALHTPVYDRQDWFTVYNTRVSRPEVIYFQQHSSCTCRAFPLE